MKEAAIIDPAPGSVEKIAKYLESQQLTPKLLLITHSHWDHTANAAEIKEMYDLPVYVHVHEDDRQNLEKPGSDKLPCWISIKEVSPDKLIKDGDLIHLGGLIFRVIHTPGHTPGGVCFYCAEEKVRNDWQLIISNCAASFDVALVGKVGETSSGHKSVSGTWRADDDWG